MGINGLLKSLESITSNKHISEYKNKRIAIDGYCWLHKSVYSMKEEIIYNPNSDKYLNYMMRRLDVLLNNKIIPVFIFDGDKLPAKKNKEDEREKKRSNTRKQGKAFLNEGNIEKAKTKFIESIDVNPRMAYKFIKILKSKKIEFIVAPYEADAQLAYLAKIKYVDMVMTEDSDLLAYCCDIVLFKLNNDGFVDEINMRNINECKDFNFKNFSQDKFLLFCILCGCDYFKLEKCGAKKAFQIVSERRDFKEIVNYLKYLNNNITDNLEKEFERAFYTFKFQVIFCPIEKRYRYFNDIESSPYSTIKEYDDLSFLGKILDEELANKIAYGEVDPISHERFESETVSAIAKIFGNNNKPKIYPNNNKKLKNETSSEYSKNISTQSSKSIYMGNEFVNNENPKPHSRNINEMKTNFLENFNNNKKENIINSYKSSWQESQNTLIGNNQKDLSFLHKEAALKINEHKNYFPNEKKVTEKNNLSFMKNPDEIVKKKEKDEKNIGFHIDLDDKFADEIKKNLKNSDSIESEENKNKIYKDMAYFDEYFLDINQIEKNKFNVGNKLDDRVDRGSFKMISNNNHLCENKINIDFPRNNIGKFIRTSSELEGIKNSFLKLDSTMNFDDYKLENEKIQENLKGNKIKECIMEENTNKNYVMNLKRKSNEVLTEANKIEDYHFLKKNLFPQGLLNKNNEKNTIFFYNNNQLFDQNPQNQSLPQENQYSDKKPNYQNLNQNNTTIKPKNTLPYITNSKYNNFSFLKNFSTGVPSDSRTKNTISLLNDCDNYLINFDKNEQNCEKISKNEFIFSHNRKKDLILLNNPERNPSIDFDLKNDINIIDLTDINNNSDNNFEEILINCKDDQINKDLMNRSFKKNNKNSFNFI